MHLTIQPHGLPTTFCGRLYFFVVVDRMESGRMMIVHSLLIGIVAYLLMVFGLRQKQQVAENRSILLAALALAYMILFGHRMPTSINKNLF